MSWSDEVTGGIREQIADGAGAFMKWQGKMIPILQDAGNAMSMLVSGGELDSGAGSATVLRSDLSRLCAGKIPKTGSLIQISGITYKVKSAVNDPADPSIRVFYVGEEQ